MAVRDPHTEWIGVKIYRGMTPQHRLRLALDLTDMARRSAISNIKKMHPGIDERGIQLFEGRDETFFIATAEDTILSKFI